MNFDFEHLLSPVELSEFLASYWEQQPLVVQRGDTGYYAGLFSLADVDHITSATGLRYPGLRLVKDGSPLPVGAYTSDLSWGNALFDRMVDPDRAIAEYRRGATLILQALHRTWRPLALFCRNLEKFFNHPVQANAYLTPQASQGFAPHYDTHDVLVLQIAGHKHWRIYDSPVPLPDRKQPYSSAGVKPGALLHELVLSPGDLIYMPRGYIHEALTGQSESLHITVGIVTYTWIDLLSEAVQLCREDPRFRRSLPVGFVQRVTPDDALTAEFDALLGAFRDRALLQELLDRVAERFVSSRPALVHGELLASVPTGGTGPETLVKRNETIVHQLRVEEDRVTLLFGGKAVSFPSFVEPALRYISQNGEFRVAALPGNLDEPGKVTLARRLLAEGFLTVV